MQLQIKQEEDNIKLSVTSTTTTSINLDVEDIQQLVEDLNNWLNKIKTK